MKIKLLATILMTLSVNASAEGAKESFKGMIGLVEVPTLLKRPESNDSGAPARSQKVTIRLYAGSDEKSKVVKQISKAEELLTLEHDYEEYSAIVFGQKNGWYLIQANASKGWLPPKDAGQFRSYENLLENSLCYLDRNKWNGRLFTSPGALKVFEKYDTEENVDINILAKRRIGDDLWFQIQVVKGRCQGEEKLGKKAWVPAFNDSGESNLWFHPRGC